MPLTPNSVIRSPFAGLLGWAAGSALQCQQAQLSPWGAYALAIGVGLAIGVALVRGRHRWVIPPLVWGAGLMLAGLLTGAGATGVRSHWFLESALSPALEGRDVWVTGVVAELPRRTEAGLRLRLSVESGVQDGLPVRLPPLMDIGWYGGAFATGENLTELIRAAPVVTAGERWQLMLRLKSPHGGSNPHGFDYELWLWEQGVQATGYVRAGPRDPAPILIGQTWLHPVSLLRQKVRDRIVESGGSKGSAGVIAALVVGDQNAIERGDWDVFRASGIAHLMSISGLHITMFAWAATWLAGWLWRRSPALCLRLPAVEAALIAGVLVALAYSLISGWGVPARRTCLMLATVVGLRLAGVRWPWPQVWMLALGVVVMSDPWALLQPGFWLSFVAVGVLFATSFSTRDAGTHAAWSGPLTRMLAQQWVVTIALAPLGLFLFGQVSLVGLLANLLAVPLVTLLVTPLCLLGTVLPIAWDGAAWMIDLLMFALQWLVSLPGATHTAARPPLLVTVAAVAGGLMLVIRLPGFIRMLGLPLLLPGLFWQAPLPPCGTFMVLAADVGQGNAILVQTCAHALVFDAGPRYSADSDAGHRVLVPLLQALSVRMDTLVLSHRDIDHTGGAKALLDMAPQAEVLSSLSPGHPLQQVRPSQRCEAGQHWRWDGVDFEVLHPPASAYDTELKSNAMSCVLRIRADGGAVLLTGDIEQLQEQQLLEHSRENLSADVLLVPHHGSKTSSSEAFLDAVNPRFAWVQSGYRNRFGHPAPVVLERYLSRNIVVQDSPHCGAMTWSSSAPGTMECNRGRERRYWFHAVP